MFHTSLCHCPLTLYVCYRWDEQQDSCLPPSLVAEGGKGDWPGKSRVFPWQGWSLHLGKAVSLGTEL